MVLWNVLTWEWDLQLLELMLLHLLVMLIRYHIIITKLGICILRFLLSEMLSRDYISWKPNVLDSNMLHNFDKSYSSSIFFLQRFIFIPCGKFCGSTVAGISSYPYIGICSESSDIIANIILESSLTRKSCTLAQIKNDSVFVSPLIFCLKLFS